MNVTTSMLVLAISASAITPATLFAAPLTTSIEKTEQQQEQLAQLITVAIKSDANMAQINAQQHAMLETSLGSNSLPDPKLKLGIVVYPLTVFLLTKIQ